ncbi:MAG: hypothetical protein MZV70_63650 [Desulfobacterales bacterium]|nr:hypothetical protein [Desulfobacterales bacterium]
MVRLQRDAFWPARRGTRSAGGGVPEAAASTRTGQVRNFRSRRPDRAPDRSRDRHVVGIGLRAGGPGSTRRPCVAYAQALAALVGLRCANPDLRLSVRFPVSRDLQVGAARRAVTRHRRMLTCLPAQQPGRPMDLETFRAALGYPFGFDSGIRAGSPVTESTLARASSALVGLRRANPTYIFYD